MKKLIIKIFGLTDIRQFLEDARNEEQKRANKEKKQALNDLEIYYKRQLELAEQSRYTEVKMLEKRLEQYAKTERDVLELEHKSKMQIKENFRVATELSQTIKNFTLSVNSIFGDIMGISDTVTKHQKKLQE
jgi:hypothetical protein